MNLRSSDGIERQAFASLGTPRHGASRLVALAAAFCLAIAQQSELYFKQVVQYGMPNWISTDESVDISGYHIVHLSCLIRSGQGKAEKKGGAW
jgi:hypothetical protein